MTEKEPPLPRQPDRIQGPNFSRFDEITLIDLIEFLIRKKTLLIVTTSIFTLVSIFYALSITPTYRAVIGVMPLAQETYLSQLPPEVTEFLPGNNSGFLNFLAILRTYKFQREVFEKGGFLRKFIDDTSTVDLDNTLQTILGSLKIVEEKKTPNSVEFAKPIYLQMEGTKPEVMSEFLTALAKSAKQQKIREIQGLIKSRIDWKINEITREIDILRLEVKKKWESEVRVFSEALIIAKSLGIKNNNFRDLKTSHNTIPLWFLYGEKALQREIESLKSRKIDDGFGWKMLHKTLDLKKYQSIDLSSMDIELAIISQPSIPPTLPINKPNKGTIIVIGMALGLFTGVLMAFLSNLKGRRREKQTSSIST